MSDTSMNPWLTDEDHAIFARRHSILRQARYHAADRRDARAMKDLTTARRSRQVTSKYARAYVRAFGVLPW